MLDELEEIERRILAGDEEAKQRLPTLWERFYGKGSWEVEEQRRHREYLKKLPQRLKELRNKFTQGLELPYSAIIYSMLEPIYEREEIGWYPGYVTGPREAGVIVYSEQNGRIKDIINELQTFNNWGIIFLESDLDVTFCHTCNLVIRETDPHYIPESSIYCRPCFLEDPEEVIDWMRENVLWLSQEDADALEQSGFLTVLNDEPLLLIIMDHLGIAYLDEGYVKSSDLVKFIENAERRTGFKTDIDDESKAVFAREILLHYASDPEDVSQWPGSIEHLFNELMETDDE